MPNSRQKLTAKERKVAQDMLLRRREVLVGDVSKMADSSLRKSVSAASGDLSTVPFHMADIGSDNFEHEFTLGLIENEEEELKLIDEALNRIEDGTFGQCVICSKPIPKSRLKVIPYAKLCIECKRDEENNKAG